jgi:hypothetical protein
MLVELLDNGIKYDWSVSGPQGARFELFVHEGHTRADIEVAKEQLKREQDVVKIYTTKLSRKEWAALKLYLHPVAKINDELNKQLNGEKTASL